MKVDVKAKVKPSTLRFFLQSWTWSLRELKNQRTFAFFFILNLCLGLSGILVVDSIQRSIGGELFLQRKSLIAADVQISARRMLTEAEKISLQQVVQQQRPGAIQISHAIEMMTMLRNVDNARLVQVRAVDKDYPFYGKFVLAKQGVVESGVTKSLQDKNALWVSPELHQDFGDHVDVGNLHLNVDDEVADDPSQSLRFASFGPRVYMDLQTLSKTGLLQLGSTVTDTYMLKLPPSADPEKIVHQLQAELKDVAVNIQSATSAGEDSMRFLTYVTQYLSLVGLVALAFASIGLSYLVRTYLQSRFADMQVYNVLGLQWPQIFVIYSLQIFQLVVVAAVLSVGVCLGLIPLFAKTVVWFFPIHVNWDIHWQSILQTLIMALLASGSSFWLAWINVQVNGTSKTLRRRWLRSLSWLPLLAGFWAFAAFSAHSFRMGSYFIFGFLVALGVLWIFGYVLLRLFGSFARFLDWQNRHAILQLVREPASSLPVITVLGLSALLLGLIPQIQFGLQQDLSSPSGLVLPSFFCVDIQDEQKQPLVDFLQQRKLQASVIAPMIRARILKINGEAFERSPDPGKAMTREEEQANRMRNRGVNLSYRSELSPTEKIVDGKWFDQAYSGEGIAGISVEQNYAKNLKIKLGDKVEFDVQGVSVQAQVQSFRTVTWNSFQPNFFMLLQPGVLDGAPKTWLATLAAMPAEASRTLQNDLLKQFPNVSLIDVRKVVQTLLELTTKITWILLLMAIFSLLSGWAVVFAIVNQRAGERIRDLNLYRVLGASHGSLLQILAMEFVVLTGLAAAMGSGLCALFAAALNWFLFEDFYPLSGWLLLGSFGLVAGSSLVISWFSARSGLKSNPIELLNARN